MQFSLILQNVTFIEYFILDKIAFYSKLSAKISLKVIPLFCIEHPYCAYINARLAH